jgi:hypothetical protein
MFLEMPHLRRSDRNQRVALAAVFLLFAIYLGVVRPLLSKFGSGRVPGQFTLGAGKK